MVAELVFFDALIPPHRTGNETAMHSLEALGLSQDFVFTVPQLDDAIDYAIACVSTADAAHWQAAAVLVVGHTPVVEAAWQHYGPRLR